MNLDNFRQEIRAYIAVNCPDSMKNRAVHFEDAHEIYATDDAHRWLRDRAVTIYGGTNEVQHNIISKQVLDLPD